MINLQPNNNFSQEVDYSLIMIFLFILAVFPISIVTIDCAFVCSSMVITEDITVCNDNCNLKYILLYSIITIVGVSAILCFVCCCIRKRCCNTVARLIAHLREEKDHPLPGEDTAEFKENCALLLQSLETSVQLNNIYFKIGEERTYIKANKCSLLGETGNIRKLTFEGETKVTKIKAEGSLLQGESDKLWCVVWFKPAVEGKRAGFPEIMIFEGGMSQGYSFRGTVVNADTKETVGMWTILAKQPESAGKLINVSAFTCLNSKV